MIKSYIKKIEILFTNNNIKMNEIIEKHLALERSGIISSIEPLKGDISIRHMITLKDWLYDVNRVFELTSNTYSLTIEILNIIVRNLQIQIKDLQLYGVACHLISSKTQEIYPTKVTEFISITDNSYTRSEIVETELKIFEFLNYNIYFPTVFYFSTNYLLEMKEHFNIEHNNYIKLYIYVFQTYDTQNSLLPSVVALACIYLGSMNFRINNLDILSNISGYTKREILRVSHEVSFLYNSALKLKTRRSIFNSLPTAKFGDITNYRSVYLEGYHYLQDNIHIVRPNYRVKEIELFHSKYIKEDSYIEELGEGAYSIVTLIEYKGHLKAQKESACMGKEGLTKHDVKELSFLRTFSNSNIIDLNAVNISISKNCSEVFMIMEYIEINLMELIEKEEIDMNLIKRYSLQLFNAIKYIHSFGILHGDIKPDNILVKGEDIKLIDFGLSVPYTVDKQTKPNIWSLQYQPIEVFFTKRYGNNADIWACGVVIAEMIRGRHLFDIDSKDIMVIHPENITMNIFEQFIDEKGDPINIDIIVVIFILNLLGTENVKIAAGDNWDSYYEKYVYEGISNMNKFKEYYDTDDELLIDLLVNTITVSEERLTVDECINHPWFVS